MHRRAVMYNACCMCVSAAALALELPAQVRAGTQRPMAEAAPTARPRGPGNVGVAITTETGLTSLGNATSVVFSDPSIPLVGSVGGRASAAIAPAPQSSSSMIPPPSGQSATPGSVVVTFATHDQQATNYSSGSSCSSPLLVLMCQLTLTVTTPSGQTVATYVMKAVNIASASAGSPSVITFAYQRIQYTLRQAAGGDGSR